MTEQLLLFDPVFGVVVQVTILFLVAIVTSRLFQNVALQKYILSAGLVCAMVSPLLILFCTVCGFEFSVSIIRLREQPSQLGIYENRGPVVLDFAAEDSRTFATEEHPNRIR